MLIKSKVELNAKIQELTDKYTNCLNEVENITINTVLKKTELEKRNAIFQAQQQWSKDMDGLHKQEQEQYKLDIEKLHIIYKERESQTMKDVQQLEISYNNKIYKLENQLNLYKEQILNSDNKLEEYKINHIKEFNNLKNDLQININKIKTYQHDLTELQKALSESYKKNQEIIYKENIFREQYKKLLETEKLKQDTIIQSNIHIQNLTTELELCKKQMKKQCITDETIISSLHIAQQEIKILENELNRIKHENNILQNIINRTDNIIYGSNNKINYNTDYNNYINENSHATNVTANYINHTNSNQNYLHNNNKSPMSCQITTNSITKPIIKKKSSASLSYNINKSINQ